MQRITTVVELRETLAGARAEGQRIGFVATMGSLHEGHLSLVREAGELADFTVVSIFVNPTQFDSEDDLAAYPRELEADEGRLRALGEAAPDAVFAPAVEEVYPREPVTTVHVERLTRRLCGATRPGHFDGVCTVVTKLLNLVQPDVAVFGRKDYQQLTVIRGMVADLNIPVEIAAAPTVREADGVAMSSRNRRLDADQRAAARALPEGLRRAVLEARGARDRGESVDPEVLSEVVRARLDEEPEIDVDVDYVEVVDPETLLPPDPGHPDSGSVRGGEEHLRDAGARRLLVAVAAELGPARLIDNVVVGDTDDEDRLLAATTPQDDDTGEAPEAG